MKLLATKNSLPSNVKETIIASLNDALAATIDLALVTKQAHWNVRGPEFIGVHEMLDNLRDGLDEQVDTIAERVAQLGGTALGTVQIVAETTKLKPYPTTIHATRNHLEALIERYAAVANLLRKSISEAADVGDDVSADVFTAAASELDKSLWFLEAHGHTGD